MFSLITSVAVLSAILTSTAQAAPWGFPGFGSGSGSDSKFSTYSAGFINPTSVSTQGGHGTCIQGTIPVYASASNTKLNFDPNSNQSAITETIVEFLQTDTPLIGKVLGESQVVKGLYNIKAQLCYPTGGSINSSMVQFLTHGVGFDKSYWDFYSQEYSYADQAAAKGYTTFFYDRLGNGGSDHPDPIQIVQAPLEVSIGHSLVQLLRSGSIASTKFSHVIGVGHSLGSELTNAVTAAYPNDFDAISLTGFTMNFAGFPSFFSALNLAIASQNQPSRFGLLPNGYTVAGSIIGNQFAFLRAQNFDPAVLQVADNTKGTFTIGELFTNSQFVKPATGYTGPVDVVNGQYDLPFCQSNCLVPTNQAAGIINALYPNAGKGSQTFIVPGAGHGINMHYTATQAYQHVFSFLTANGF